MLNIGLPVDGPAARLNLPRRELERETSKLTSSYREKLCAELHAKLGFEFEQGALKEPQVIGVPQSIDLQSGDHARNAGPVSKFFYTPEFLTVKGWRQEAAEQGWGSRDAKALIKYSQERKSAWSTLGSAAQERIKQKQQENGGATFDETKSKSNSQSQSSGQSHSQ